MGYEVAIATSMLSQRTSHEKISVVLMQSAQDNLPYV